MALFPQVDDAGEAGEEQGQRGEDERLQRRGRPGSGAVDAGLGAQVGHDGGDMARKGLALRRPLGMGGLI